MEEGYAWAAVVWINDHILELGLTAFYSLCIITVFAVINKRFLKKKRQKDKEKTTDLPRESTSGRRLCRIESSVDHLHKYGGSIAAYVLLLKSKIYLNPSMVKNALVYLTKRHEVLRMKITRKKTKIQGRKKIVKEFKVMENSDFAEFLLKLKATTSDQWLSVFERELMKQFPEEGPLWRFVMLKEQFHPKEGVYSNAFVFSAHQLVCDCESGLVFFSDFLDYLNSDIQGSLSNPDVDVEYPLQPSFSHLINNHISMSQPMIAVTAAKVFAMKMIEKIRPEPTYKNPFTSTFPPTIKTDPTVQKKTCFIPRSLTKEQTLTLVKSCKANKCTVYGAVSAATTVAMATVLGKEKSTAPLIINSSFQVDLRKDCNPQIDPKELGHFSTKCSIKVLLSEDITLPLGIHDASFWLLAQKCDKIFHTAVTERDYFNDMKMMINLNINPLRNLGELAQDQEAAGRHSSLFHVSNLGKKSMVNSDHISFEGFYFALAEHNIGPVFSNNIATINGMLYWGFSYFSNVTTEAQAVRYANLVMSSLRGNTLRQ